MIKRKKLICFTMALSIISSYLISSNNSNVKAEELPSSQVNINRIYGMNRYETAVEVSKRGWSSGAENVILATGENFPDSLCASPLAAKLKAPILLTEKQVLNTCTKNEIRRLSPKNVYIIGLTGVISDNIEKDIRNMGINVIRVGGKDRYETSYKIVSMINASDKVFVVTGDDFPDALSVAVIAGKKQIPIILSYKDGISNDFINYVKVNKVSKTYIIGGQGVISDNVAQKLPNTVRLFGKSRYETNLEIANEFYDDFKYDTVYMATGENFPDALSGAALAVGTNSPIILSNSLTQDKVKDFMESNLYSLKNITFLGGEAVISSKAIQYLNYNKDANAKNPLKIKTYDGSDQCCHPKVLYFPNGWNGWKYWMTYTPYPNGDDYFENPSLAVSQNGTKWYTPNGVKNPLIPSPTLKGLHNSDPHLVYNSNTNELELWYRYTVFDKKDYIYKMVSTDGINWSGPKVGYDVPEGEKCLSPAIIYEDGKYKMWYVNQAYKCMYTECDAVNNTWTTPVEVNLGLETMFLPWHLDVVHTDLGYEMVLTTIRRDEVEANQLKTYFLSHSVSGDGVNFNGFQLVLNGKFNTDAWDNNFIYRSTFVKVDGIYKLFYSAMDTNHKWHIGLTQGTNFKELQGYNYSSDQQ